MAIDEFTISVGRVDVFGPGETNARFSFVHESHGSNQFL